MALRGPRSSIPSWFAVFPALVAIVLLTCPVSPAWARPIPADSATSTSNGGGPSTHPTFAFVLDYASSKVTVINTSSFKIAAHVGLGMANPAPRGACFSPITHEVYVADSGSNLKGLISIINATNNSLAAVIDDGGATPWACAYDPVNGNVYVTNYGSASVSVISRHDRVVAQVRLGQGPSSLDVNPATGDVFVLCTGNSSRLTSMGQFFVLSGSNHSVLARVQLGLNVYPIALAFDPSSDRLFVGTSGRFWIFNGSDLSLVSQGRPAISGGQPENAFDNPFTSRVYWLEGAVYAFNMTSGLPIHLQKAGTPYGGAYDPLSHGLYFAGGSTFAAFRSDNTKVASLSFGTILTGIAVAY